MTDEAHDPDDTASGGIERPDTRHPRRRHRTWAQRAVLGLSGFVTLSCFVTAVGLYYGSEKANDRKVVDIIGANGAPSLTMPTVTGDAGSTEDTVPNSDLPANVDLTAKNFLITGSDNGACVDPDSPYAAAFGDRNGLGERADTIMILRLDPSTNMAAVLSFPRDLWVRINGKKSMGRINTAFQRDDPNPLILTIFDNFGILVDHYVNVDFCAFKQLVDAVGGVRVSFATPVRDSHTNLLIDTAGCHTFSGEEGLAYVRSRHLKYYDAKSKKWIEDPAADRGRISRQQDFLRRAIQKSLDKGVANPTVAKELIDAAIEYVYLDSGLNVGKLLDLASAMKNLDPSTMKTYQIEGVGKLISEQSVIEPRLKGDNMKAVLAVFQGKARLLDAPEQIFEIYASTTTVASSPTTTAKSGSNAAPTATTQPGKTTTTTLMPVYVDSNSVGILPTDDPACR